MVLGGHYLDSVLWLGAGAKEAQVRRMLPGAETVLGDAAAPDELFLSDAFETRCRGATMSPCHRPS